jgi:hypothetical protein
MPNWCMNYLMVDGSEKDVQRFKKDVKSKEYDLVLDGVHPMPKSLENTTAPDDKPNWYDWRIKNWGTKWDVEGKLIEELGCNLQYVFQSAWSPPVAWLKKVSKRYPRLFFRLQYYEEDIGFMGIAKAKNGRVDDHELDTKPWFIERWENRLGSMSSVVDSVIVGVTNVCSRMTDYVSSLLLERR